MPKCVQTLKAVLSQNERLASRLGCESRITVSYTIQYNVAVLRIHMGYWKRLDDPALALCLEATICPKDRPIIHLQKFEH